MAQPIPQLIKVFICPFEMKKLKCNNESSLLINGASPAIQNAWIIPEERNR